MIEVQNLTKWYGPTLAVNNLSFHIPAGEVVGFLGPNGAGKSTTLRMLTGYLPPTSGKATIDNFDVTTQSADARRRLGYLPESTPLYLEMRVEEYLHYRGKLLSMDRATRRKRIDIVVDRCGLTKVRRRVIGHLSKGNRQRVGIAQALLHEPPVLILDEPTAGLDPNQINEVRKLISELRGSHTILLSTHILPEVEKAADRVMIIANGSIVAQGTPADLRRQVSQGARVLIELKANAEAVRKAFQAVPNIADLDTAMHGEWCQAIVTPCNNDDLREVLGMTALNNHWPVREVRHETASLEQFFVQITARQGQAAASA